jgi:hypothetical protein
MNRSGANAFFLNEVVDDRVNPIPAQLLSGLARFAITDDGDLTVRVVTQLFCSAGQQCLCILAQYD